MFRTIVIVMLALLAGAATNVAVAWAIAIAAHVNDLTPAVSNVPVGGTARKVVAHGQPPFDWWFTLSTSTGATRLASQSVGKLPDDLWRNRVSESAGTIASESPDLAWAREVVSEHVGWDRLEFWSVGWPCRTLWCVERGGDAYNTRGQLERGIPLGRKPGPVRRRNILSGDDWRMPGLPLAPHWTGFAANTLMYGLLIALLAALVRAARCQLRTRRGQCVRCAHLLAAATVCPECGRRR